MKLLPLLLLICLDCGAQLPDSLAGTNLTIATSMTTISTGTITRKIQEPKFDTVRVIMLCADTTSWQWRDSAIVNHKLVEVGVSEKRYPVRECYWKFGYEVRENEQPIFYYDHAMAPKWATPFRHVSYLDDRRRALSKSIIVWQSIKL